MHIEIQLEMKCDATNFYGSPVIQLYIIEHFYALLFGSLISSWEQRVRGSIRNG